MAVGQHCSHITTLAWTYVKLLMVSLQSRPGSGREADPVNRGGSGAGLGPQPSSEKLVLICPVSNPLHPVLYATSRVGAAEMFPQVLAAVFKFWAPWTWTGITLLSVGFGLPNLIKSSDLCQPSMRIR